jgi:hypothetical protein
VFGAAAGVAAGVTMERWLSLLASWLEPLTH